MPEFFTWSELETTASIADVLDAHRVKETRVALENRARERSTKR